MNIKQLNEELDKILSIFNETSDDNVIISKRKMNVNQYHYRLYDITSDKILTGLTTEGMTNPDNYVKEYFKKQGFNVDKVRIKNEMSVELQKELEERGYTDKRKYRVVKRVKNGDVFVDIDRLEPTYISQIDHFILYGGHANRELSDLYR